MGQYYYCVNLDKKTYLQAHDYDNGLKLMEHSWIGNSMMNHAEHLLANEWKGDRIVWAGDYMDNGLYVSDDDLLTLQAKYKDQESEDESIEKDNITLYSVAGECFDRTIANQDLETLGRYIVDHTKKEYIDKFNLKGNNGWIVHPLSLLTSSGNGRGGGDYHPLNEEVDGLYVGSWAGDSISIERPPKGYKEITPGFYED